MPTGDLSSRTEVAATAVCVAVLVIVDEELCCWKAPRVRVGCLTVGKNEEKREENARFHGDREKVALSTRVEGQSATDFLIECELMGLPPVHSTRLFGEDEAGSGEEFLMIPKYSLTGREE